MRVVIDSNVFIAFFWKNDPNRDKAIEIIDKIKNKEIEVFVPALFLPEVCGSIQRRTNDTSTTIQIKQKLLSLIEENILTEIELTKNRIKSVSETAIKFSLKGPDAVYADLAIEKKASLITFDGEIKRKIKGKVKLFEI